MGRQGNNWRTERNVGPRHRLFFPVRLAFERFYTGVLIFLTACPRWVLDPSLSRLSSGTRGMYDYTKSRTASAMNGSFLATYGAGVVEGRVITETMTIGTLTMRNVPMGIANSTSAYFLGGPFVGLLGLGPPPTYGKQAVLSIFFLFFFSLVPPSCPCCKRYTPRTD